MKHFNLELENESLERKAIKGEAIRRQGFKFDYRDGTASDQEEL